MAQNDMVKFLMPDGTEVSNDPRFGMEEAREKVLESKENTGDAGISNAEQTAQTQTEHPANLNSGQPGVGEHAVPDDPHDYIPNTGTPAMRGQREDSLEAYNDDADLTDTSVRDADPVDSNEAVKGVREQSAEERKAVLKAQQKLGGEDPGDPEKPYIEWTGKQLKFELAKRNASRDEGEKISTKGVKNKAQLAELLDGDDTHNQS